MAHTHEGTRRGYCNDRYAAARNAFE